MKADIHPKYVDCAVACACGNKFTTRSVKSEIRTDICSACHPYFTGAAKFVLRPLPYQPQQAHEGRREGLGGLRLDGERSPRTRSSRTPPR